MTAAPSERTPKPGTLQPAEGSAGHQLLKLAIELGPLGVFFLVNGRYGIFQATSAFMVATAVSLIASRLLLGKIAVMPLVTGVFVLVFGGLTLWLHNETFIKVKPTIVNLLFATLLLGGLAFGKPLLSYLFGDAFKLDREGWRKLTLRWGLFFVTLAALNEIVWRNATTDAWVAFKTFGILPLSFVFALSQIGLIMRHQLQPQIDKDARRDS
jgi:intracellular septation protein